ncbi:MAG: biliverdin-producing heme oxygenase [Dongiaceae bacterium]
MTQEGTESGLADRLRERTAGLHAEAERSGIVREMLRGAPSRRGHALLLRNLLPAYRALERGLAAHAASPGVRWTARPEVFRAPAIAHDLALLAGTGWGESLALLPAGERYGRQAAAAAAGDGGRLVAHAYVRYLGDLSGGRILRRRLAAAPGMAPAMLSFYDFPAIADLDAFRRDYRAAIDRAGGELAAVEAVLEEAEAAFRLNIELSEAVLQALPEAA